MTPLATVATVFTVFACGIVAAGVAVVIIEAVGANRRYQHKATVYTALDDDATPDRELLAIRQARAIVADCWIEEVR